MKLRLPSTRSQVLGGAIAAGLNEHGFMSSQYLVPYFFYHCDCISIAWLGHSIFSAFFLLIPVNGQADLEHGCTFIHLHLFKVADVSYRISPGSLGNQFVHMHRQHFREK